MLSPAPRLPRASARALSFAVLLGFAPAAAATSACGGDLVHEHVVSFVLVRLAGLVGLDRDVSGYPGRIRGRLRARHV